MAILSVVEQAYRATIEEQDDTVLWFTHMIKKAGGPVNILLRGNAVNYAAKGQNASGLTIGGIPMKVAPTIEHDVLELIASGVEVYAVGEDLKTLGIDSHGLIEGVNVVSQGDIASLFDRHDSIWHW